MATGNIAAGDLNRRIEIQKREQGTDDVGQPLDTWVTVGKLWANIGNQSGIGAIKTGLQENVPESITGYSFMVRFESARALAVDAGMRVLHAGLIFDVKGVSQDLKNRDRAFIICTQGGNDG
jgi:SPP1 family predicted phage head-tail adaptor